MDNPIISYGTYRISHTVGALLAVVDSIRL